MRFKVISLWARELKIKSRNFNFNNLIIAFAKLHILKSISNSAFFITPSSVLFYLSKENSKVLNGFHYFLLL